jgi:hypothetical protein
MLQLQLPNKSLTTDGRRLSSHYLLDTILIPFSNRNTRSVYIYFLPDRECQPTFTNPWNFGKVAVSYPGCRCWSPTNNNPPKPIKTTPNPIGTVGGAAIPAVFCTLPLA